MMRPGFPGAPGAGGAGSMNPAELMTIRHSIATHEAGLANLRTWKNETTAAIGSLEAKIEALTKLVEQQQDTIQALLRSGRTLAPPDAASSPAVIGEAALAEEESLQTASAQALAARDGPADGNVQQETAGPDEELPSGSAPNGAPAAEAPSSSSTSSSSSSSASANETASAAAVPTEAIASVSTADAERPDDAPGRQTETAEQHTTTAAASTKAKQPTAEPEKEKDEEEAEDPEISRLGPYELRYLSLTLKKGGSKAGGSGAANSAASAPASASAGAGAGAASNYSTVSSSSIASEPPALNSYGYLPPGTSSVASFSYGTLDDAAPGDAATTTATTDDGSNAASMYGTLEPAVMLAPPASASAAPPVDSFSAYGSLEDAASPAPTQPQPPSTLQPLPAANAYGSLDDAGAAAADTEESMHNPYGSLSDAGDADASDNSTTAGDALLVCPQPTAPLQPAPSSVSSSSSRDWSAEWARALELPSSTSLQRLQRLVALSRISADFTSACQAVVRTLIDETALAVPVERRTLKAAAVGGIAGGVKFVHEGIFYKLAVDDSGLYGGTEFAQKASSLELSNLRTLLKAHETLQAMDGLKLNQTEGSLHSSGLRFPLACLLDYAGYRVLALAQLPIDSSTTLAYGSADAARTVRDGTPDMRASMERVAGRLNLKKHTVGTTRGATKDLVVCADIEVHSGKDGRQWVVDTARVFPPEAPASTLTAFLLHAYRAPHGTSSSSSSAPAQRFLPSSGTSIVSHVDISRARPLEEIAAVLGVEGNLSSLTSAGVLRIPMPGATLCMRADANPHLRGAASVNNGNADTAGGTRLVTVQEHLSLSAKYGISHIGSAMLDSFGVGHGLLKGTQLPIYGDCVVVVGERSQHLYFCLRPQLVGASPFPVSSDAFSFFARWDPRASHHNAQVKAITAELMQHVQPAVADRLRGRGLRPIYTFRESDLAQELHAAGINLRFAGVLRTQMPAGMINQDVPENRLPPLVRRARMLLLTSMISRVLKHLLKNVLRNVPAIVGSTTAGPVRAAGDPGADHGDDDNAALEKSGPATEDPRLIVLRWCLATIFAPMGAWKESEASLLLSSAGEGGSERAAPAPGAPISEALAAAQHHLVDGEALWRVIIRPFCQLKYATQAPPLSPTEAETSYDLRTALDKLVTLTSLCEQLGIKLSPAWLKGFQAAVGVGTDNGGNNSGGLTVREGRDPKRTAAVRKVGQKLVRLMRRTATRTRALAPADLSKPLPLGVRHIHDPILLPRVLRKPEQNPLLQEYCEGVLRDSDPADGASRAVATSSSVGTATAAPVEDLGQYTSPFFLHRRDARVACVDEPSSASTAVASSDAIALCTTKLAARSHWPAADTASVVEVLNQQREQTVAGQQRAAAAGLVSNPVFSLAPMKAAAVLENVFGTSYGHTNLGRIGSNLGRETFAATVQDWSRAVFDLADKENDQAAALRVLQEAGVSRKLLQEIRKRGRGGDDSDELPFAVNPNLPFETAEDGATHTGGLPDQGVPGKGRLDDADADDGSNSALEAYEFLKSGDIEELTVSSNAIVGDLLTAARLRMQPSCAGPVATFARAWLTMMTLAPSFDPLLCSADCEIPSCIVALPAPTVAAAPSVGAGHGGRVEDNVGDDEEEALLLHSIEHEIEPFLLGTTLCPASSVLLKPMTGQCAYAVSNLRLEKRLPKAPTTTPVSAAADLSAMEDDSDSNSVCVKFQVRCESTRDGGGPMTDGVFVGFCQVPLRFTVPNTASPDTATVSASTSTRIAAEGWWGLDLGTMEVVNNGARTRSNASLASLTGDGEIVAIEVSFHVDFLRATAIITVNGQSVPGVKLSGLPLHPGSGSAAQAARSGSNEQARKDAVRAASDAINSELRAVALLSAGATVDAPSERPPVGIFAEQRECRVTFALDDFKCAGSSVNQSFPPVSFVDSNGRACPLRDTAVASAAPPSAPLCFAVEKLIGLASARLEEEDARVILQSPRDAGIPQDLMDAASKQLSAKGVQVPSWDRFTGKRLCYYLHRTIFNRCHRFTLDACVDLAEEALEQSKVGVSKVERAVSILEFGLSSTAVPRTGSAAPFRIPAHVAARAYVLLGDACLAKDPVSGSESPEQRRRYYYARYWAAERWYARAYQVMASLSPDPSNEAWAAAMLYSALGRKLLNEETDSFAEQAFGYSHCAYYSTYPQPSETHELGLQPYLLMILDRLCGAIVAQGRAHHAVAPAFLFLRLWQTHYCPTHYLDHVDRDSFWPDKWKDDDDDNHSSSQCRSPYYRAFGRACPAVVPVHASFVSDLSGFGYRATEDVFDPASYALTAAEGALRPSIVGSPNDEPKRSADTSSHPQAATRSIRPVLPLTLETWLRPIARPFDAGAFYDLDVEDPADSLGIRGFGPDPRDFCLTGGLSSDGARLSRDCSLEYRLAEMRGVGALAAQDPHLGEGGQGDDVVASGSAAKGGNNDGGRLFTWSNTLPEAELAPVPVSTDLRAFVRRNENDPSSSSAAPAAGPSATALTRRQGSAAGGDPYRAEFPNNAAFWLLLGKEPEERVLHAGLLPYSPAVEPFTSIHGGGASNAFFAVQGKSGRAFAIATHWSGCSLENGVAVRELGASDSDEKVLGYRMVPMRTLMGKRIISVACGTAFAAFLDAHGRVFTCGENESGCLGHGDVAKRTTPQMVRGLDGIQVTAIAAGRNHCVAACEPLLSSSASSSSKGVIAALSTMQRTLAFAWGQNSFGCCGFGHNRSSLFPAAVVGIQSRPNAGLTDPSHQEQRITKVVCAQDGDSTVFLTSDGLLWRCGDFRWAVAGGLPAGAESGWYVRHGTRGFLESVGGLRGNEPECMTCPGVFATPSLVFPPQDSSLEAGASAPGRGTTSGYGPILSVPFIALGNSSLPSASASAVSSSQLPPNRPVLARAASSSAAEKTAAADAAVANAIAVAAHPSQCGFLYVAPSAPLDASDGTGRFAAFTDVALHNFGLMATTADGKLYSQGFKYHVGHGRWAKDSPCRRLVRVSGFGGKHSNKVAVGVHTRSSDHSFTFFVVAARREDPELRPPYMSSKLEAFFRPAPTAEGVSPGGRTVYDVYAIATETSGIRLASLEMDAQVPRSAAKVAGSSALAPLLRHSAGIAGPMLMPYFSSLALPPAAISDCGDGRLLLLSGSSESSSTSRAVKAAIAALHYPSEPSAHAACHPMSFSVSQVSSCEANAAWCAPAVHHSDTLVVRTWPQDSSSDGEVDRDGRTPPILEVRPLGTSAGEVSLRGCSCLEGDEPKPSASHDRAVYRATAYLGLDPRSNPLLAMTWPHKVTSKPFALHT